KLKTDLKLTPAQETAWNTYAATFKPGERPQRMEREDFAKLTTPQRIDKMREMRAKRDAEMDRRADATKAFYAQLNAEQQKTFDAASLRMHHQRGEHHHGHHGGKPGQERPAAPAPAAK
ncbi:MAG: Spy/CpxP family protein refolding chaperone, partial [Comamonas sp.]